MSLAVLYVLAACLFAASASAQKPAMNLHQLALKEHYEHLAMIAEFECGAPQPRLLNVHELLPESQITGKAYFPEVTVLHRCDRHVGSCNDATHQCGPTLASSVNMPFKVTYLEEMGGHCKGEWEMEYHSLENHTACGCLKYDGPKPSRTAVHYHYIDPSLMPPQNFLPLDNTSQNPQGNISSYDVPLYQPNNTLAPSRNETEPSRPSIYEMTKLAEEEVELGSDKEVRPVPPEEEVQAKPEVDNPCTSCDESQSYPGYPGYPSSESSIGNEVRESSSTPDPPSYVDEVKDSDATTISSDLIRFGAVDSPRSEALTHVDSPYDAFLKQSELIRFGAVDSPRPEAITHVDSPYDAYLKQSS